MQLTPNSYHATIFKISPSSFHKPLRPVEELTLVTQAGIVQVSQSPSSESITDILKYPLHPSLSCTVPATPSALPPLNHAYKTVLQDQRINKNNKVPSPPPTIMRSPSAIYRVFTTQVKRRRGKNRFEKTPHQQLRTYQPVFTRYGMYKDPGTHGKEHSCLGSGRRERALLQPRVTNSACVRSAYS
ncbi:hypothetical protein HYFRA_00005023 [Hymenoscyphus fraxineus]|uniref:Uncharacterized protein n=1 Tax=Hymenoscyphus fraxineus TaxID=746836 RepID=A0A9N9KKJ2_9HELO|nr:hypothetical protein HYFRA_00005023 [Hymenoscyphus fraxineus]